MVYWSLFLGPIFVLLGILLLWQFGHESLARWMGILTIVYGIFRFGWGLRQYRKRKKDF
ncbi:MAG: DUF202 domain-containing protein [Bacteroidia bacterium]